MAAWFFLVNGMAPCDHLWREKKGYPMLAGKPSGILLYPFLAIFLLFFVFLHLPFAAQR